MVYALGKTSKRLAGRSPLNDRRLSAQLGWRMIATTAILSLVFVIVFLVFAQRLLIADFKANVNNLLDNTVPFAAVAAYATSHSTAAQALTLLHDSPWIEQATILDDFGDVLASYHNRDVASGVLAQKEARTIALRIDKSDTIVGKLAVVISYRPSAYGRLFIYSGITAIVVTSLTLAILLHLILRQKLFAPLGRIEEFLAGLPTADMSQAGTADFGSKELDDLALAFHNASLRASKASEDKNRALAERHNALTQRAVLADAMDYALGQAGIFLRIFDSTGQGERMRFGADVPGAIEPILADIEKTKVDVRKIKAKTYDDVEFAQTPSWPPDRHRGGSESFSVQLKLRDASVWTLTRVSVGVKKFAIVGTDITELERLRDDAESARRLEAIGVLTSGVAHDFNNVLAVIIGSLGLEGAVGRNSARVQTALDAARRGSYLVRRLLDASRQSAHETDVVDQARIVSEVARQFAELTGAPDRLTLDIETDAHVLAEPEQLGATLLNLLLNARDASPASGKIELAVKEVSAEEAATHNLDADQHYIRFCITDHGTGMSDGVLSRIFDPFFTTKPPGMGSGLGLSLAHSFARRSKGTISVKSRPGVGTTVSLFLVATTESAAAAGDEERWPALQGQLAGYEILLIEDDAELNRTITDFLQLYGATVLGAETLAQGRELMTSAGAPRFDVILSDVFLPDGKGTEIINLVQERKSSSAIILMSGNFDINALDADRRAAVKTCLIKPVSFQKLMDAILE